MNSNEIKNLFKLCLKDDNVTECHGLGFGTTISKYLISCLGPMSSAYVESEPLIGTKIAFYLYND